MEKIVLILDGSEKTTYAVGCSLKDLQNNKNVTDGNFDFFSNSEINWLISDYTSNEDEKVDFTNKIKQRFDKNYEIVLVPSLQENNQEITSSIPNKLLNKFNIRKFVELVNNTFR